MPSRLDVGFDPPAACVQWCQLRDFELHVLDDGVEVDLNWWNQHVREVGLDVRLRGRDLAGQISTRANAAMRRFPDVRNPHLAAPDENPLAKILKVLDGCARDRMLRETRSRFWSGRPDTPGVGVSLIATFMWAVRGQSRAAAHN